MINKFIAQYRFLKVKQNIIENMIQLLSIIIGILLLSIFIEKVFFLSEISRYKIFLLITTSIIVSMLYLSIKSILNIRAINQNFSNENLSREIGDKVPSLSDKITNILQLSRLSEENKRKKQLSKIAIDSNTEELRTINIKSLIPNISNVIKISSFLVTSIFILLMISHEGSSNSLNRIYNYNQAYHPPTPFKIFSQNESIKTIASGNDELINFYVKGKGPQYLTLYYSYNNIIDSVRINDDNGNFQYTLKDIRQNTKYWASYRSNQIISAWDLIKSDTNYIEVINRPVFTDINFEINYPKYINKENQKITGNTVQFDALKESLITCKAKANQSIDSGYLILNKKDTLYLKNNSSIWKTQFEANEDLSIEIIGEVNFENLKIQNEVPPIYKIRTKFDNPPDIYMVEPIDNTFEINTDNKISTHFQINDDFGLEASWIEFNIIKPNYIESDSTIYINSINNYDGKVKFLKEKYVFDTNPLNLFPGDQIKFRIVCSDNKPNSNISKSSYYYAIIPSFDDIFDSMFEEENKVQELSNNISEQVENIEQNLEDMKLDMLKSTEANWEHQKKGEESIEQMEKLLDEIEEMQATLKKLEQEAEKGNLLDEDLVQKFNQFQELLNSMMTPELMDALQKMQEAIDEMNLEKMLEAAENFEYNLQQFEQQLDRFIEMFELAIAEQKLDELVNSLESLTENQNNIKDKLINNTDLKQLEGEQERQNQNYEKLQKTMQEAIKSLEKFSEDTSNSLNKLLESDLNKQTQESLDKSQKSLSNNTQNILENLSESSKNLNSMLEETKSIKDSFKEESVQEMSKKFYGVIRDILTLSNNQENLLENFENIRRSSPQLKSLTAKQFNIDKQFANFTNQLFDLSTKTFHISPDISKKVGFCKKSINNSVFNLEQRDVRKSILEQDNIIGSMNEIALMLINSMNEMQSTGSAAGLESYLEQLDQIGQGQSEINMGTMQLGQMGMMSQQEMMKRLQAEQQALKQQLEQLIEDMPGNQGQGGLSKAAEDMEDVINSFKNNRINSETKNKQQKILSRLLDSQKSLKKRDFSDKRKGEIADNIDYQGPLELPNDLGEKDLLFINAMEEALKQNYSKEYEEIFKIYFRELQKSSNE